MTRISNYTELRAERIRLEYELRNQKALLKSEIRVVKEKLEPVGDIISFLGIFKKKETCAAFIPFSKSFSIRNYSGTWNFIRHYNSISC